MKAKAKKKPNKKQEVQPVEEAIFYAIDVSDGYEKEDCVGEAIVLGPYYSEEELKFELREYCLPDEDISSYQFIIVKQVNTVAVELTRSMNISYDVALDTTPREELSGWRQWTDDEKQD